MDVVNVEIANLDDYQSSGYGRPDGVVGTF